MMRRPKKANFAESWSGISEVTTAVMSESGVSREEWCEQITSVYYLCMAMPDSLAEELYNRLKEYLTSHVRRFGYNLLFVVFTAYPEVSLNFLLMSKDFYAAWLFAENLLEGFTVSMSQSFKLNYSVLTCLRLSNNHSCREKVVENEADILPTYNSLYKTFSRGATYLNDLYMLVKQCMYSVHYTCLSYTVPGGGGG